MSTKEFVSPVTWTSSPEWAKELAINPHGVSAWLGDVGYVYLTDIGRFHEWSDPSNFPRDRFKVVESRPVVWGGEGLPPAGLECEVKHVGHDEWARQKINYIGAQKGIVVFQGSGESEFACPVGSCEFRPFRTAERITEEDRDKFISGICDLLGWDSSTTGAQVDAGRLFIAGYRKFEIVDE